MTALLRYDASGVPQILHHEPAFLNSQDAVLTVFGDGDQIAGFPVADGEFHGAEWLAGLGFELVTVQHSATFAKLEHDRLQLGGLTVERVTDSQAGCIDRGCDDESTRLRVVSLQRVPLLVERPYRVSEIISHNANPKGQPRG